MQSIARVPAVTCRAEAGSSSIARQAPQPAAPASVPRLASVVQRAQKLAAATVIATGRWRGGGALDPEGLIAQSTNNPPPFLVHLFLVELTSPTLLRPSHAHACCLAHLIPLHRLACQTPRLAQAWLWRLRWRTLPRSCLPAQRRCTSS